MILEEYIPIIIRFVIARSLATLMYGGSYVAGYQKGDTEKVSPYECGFDPFEDAREKFQVKFYLVRILFLIFDLEVVYLFPWAVTLNAKEIRHFTPLLSDFGLRPINNIKTTSFALSEINYRMILIFLFILTIGFVYEWKKGALDWSEGK